MKRILLLLALVTGFARLAVADGLIVIHDPPSVPRGHYAFAPLEVVYHHVTVRIDGQIARTSIDQEFFNPNNRQLEGTYLFPVPKGAQLDKFTMEIGGKQVAAELLPAAKARQIYEDIVRKLQDPALLEYADRDTFKVRIFPIEPRSNKRVTLSYSQVLPADSGLVSYLYPLNTEKFSAQPVKSISLKIELDAQRPLKSIYSPSHPVEIRRHGATRATIGFEAKDVRPDTDFQLLFTTEKNDLGVNLLTFRDGEGDGDAGYFLLLAAPGADRPATDIVRKDVAFVLDTSGSMAGEKLRQAKTALAFCVENLNDGDRFEIVRFSTEAELLFGKLVAADRGNRARATEFIEGLRPIGGTALEEALLQALALRPDQDDRPYVVIFLTDGQPTIGNTREADILAAVNRANTGNTRIFCFGIGADLNTHLLDKLTEQTRAFSQYVLPEEDLELKVSTFFTKIKEPVLANVTLAVTGGVTVGKLYPHPLPDLFRGDQLVLAGRYSGHGPATVVIEGIVNGKPENHAFDVNFAARATDHEFIPRLWAARRIGYLLDESRLRGENKELVEEIAELARRYGIVTPYTAYLIVEDEARREVPVPQRSFRDFDRDPRAREAAGQAWTAFNERKTGAPAVAGARASASLRQAEQFGGYKGATAAEGQRALSAAATAADAAVGRIGDYAQQTKFVNGRAFVQNGAQWIDTRVQAATRAPRVQVTFNSPEYYRLLAQHPVALPWAALGRNVQFVLGDAVYEITE